MYVCHYVEEGLSVKQRVYVGLGIITSILQYYPYGEAQWFLSKVCLHSQMCLCSFIGISIGFGLALGLSIMGLANWGKVRWRCIEPHAKDIMKQTKASINAFIAHRVQKLQCQLSILKNVRCTICK